ncbi:unnamed protein product [Rhizophagus irregularis]|nr:unnamed protein product [Rhizophagus irregularis]
MTVITQEMGLKTEKQMRTYEKIIREIQNFMMNIIYENYEQRFERKMSETSIGDNNENVKNHNNGMMNKIMILKIGKIITIIIDNENNINTASQRNNDTDIRNGKENIEDQENYNDNNIRNGNAKNIMDQENNDSDNDNTVENDDNMGSDDIENIENWENNYDNNNRSFENQEINDNNGNIENTNENQNNENIVEMNDDTNNEVMQIDENQELRINFENGDGKEKIIGKTKNSYIYQERKIKNKEKLDNLIKELTTEGSNVLEEGINEESEDIIKLFRKMERNKLKQIINGYQFAKMVIKEREELYRDRNKSEVAEKVNKKIWKGMPGYSYLTIRRKTGQAIKVYEMFSKIGGKKRIMRIKDFTWSYISRLNEEERQYVINGVKAIEKGDNGLNENQ